MITTATYTIGRPPLHKNFALPSRDDLLLLQSGDFVKLIFAPNRSKNMVERMWIKITSIGDWQNEWQGTLSNTPFDFDAFGLEHGDLVRFHPLDIIAFQKGQEA